MSKNSKFPRSAVVRVTKRRKSSGRRERNALFGSLSELVQRRIDGVSVIRTVATELYESLSTPISLSCEILLRYDQLDQLVSKKVAPVDYIDPFRFRDDYQAISFLKKIDMEIPGLDPQAKAEEKFLESELSCRDTNVRIRNFLARPNSVGAEYRESFSIVQRKIQEVIGSYPNVAEWINSCRFGPGAFNHPKVSGLTSHYDKLQVTPSVTTDFLELGDMLAKSSPAWSRSLLGIENGHPTSSNSLCTPIPGNKVTFVPKTAVTHRPIAIEPLMNIYAQLGLGDMIRRRLRRKVGIDLSDQSANQRAALEGSKTGLLATIDLSSASDTISRELVRGLLPDAWYSALDITRSKIGLYKDNWIRYEKFSSMGNGFTFELETLIFWAICSSACEISNVSDFEVLTYGDDIIVPVEVADLTLKLLKWYGFTPNSDKTFSTGVFRESCGSDYFDGVQVRPFFQKEVPREIQSLFKLANGLKVKAHGRNHFIGCDERFYPVWRRVVSYIPSSVRKHIVGPASAGPTTVLYSDWDEAQKSLFIRSHRDGWEGSHGCGLLPVPLQSSKVTNFEGAIATLLYRLTDGEKMLDSAPVSLRQGRGIQYRLRECAFLGAWTQLGPWQ